MTEGPSMPEPAPEAAPESMPEPTSRSTTGRRVLQRVVLPIDHNPDVLPLYVDGRHASPPPKVESTTETGAGTLRAATEAVREELATAAAWDDALSESALWTYEGEDDPAFRRSVSVRAGRRISFGTYFNAFPASYWRRWSTIDEVLLRVRVSGDASVTVYRSTAKGLNQPIRMASVEGEPQTLEFRLPLKPFIDGGWYWFDVAAGEHDARLEEADWCAVTDRLESGRVSIGITTFNRPDFCVELLRSLGAADEVLAAVDEIFLVDQGTQRVEDHPEFAEAAKGVADRLRVIYQGNLGGSGGFSRAMDETARAGNSTYVLLLDDDIAIEPEGILRAVTFADLARTPTVVGGHMFNLYDRSVLHAFGETVARYRWFWGKAPHTRNGHNFGYYSLRHTPWLHRRVDVDYNGWWMCLIPTDMVRELGLALPLFIKWDDAEYCLRARSAGYPTVSMPGAAVWHVTWQEKDDAVDWQAYFHRRNRMVTALLHSPYKRGGRMVQESFVAQIRHLLCMQYSTAEMGLLAIQDLLAGPGQMHADVVRKMGQLRELRQGFADAQTQGDLATFPPVRRRRPPRKDKEHTPPSSKLGALSRALFALARQFLPVGSLARQHPQAAVPHQDVHWSLLASYDSAIVSGADGTGAAWHQRDPKRFVSLLWRSLALHLRLLSRWPRLSTEYHAGAVDLTSSEQWQQTFETRA